MNHEKGKSLGFAILVVTFSFSLNVASSLIIKLVRSDIPIAQIAFARFLFGLIALQIIYFFQNKKLKFFFPQDRIGLHFGRTSLGICSVLSSIHVLGYLSLGDQQAIGYLNPIIFSIFGWIFLKESVSALRWLAIMLGLIGVSLVASPSYGAFSLPLVLYILGCIAAASSDIYVRLLRREGESSQNIVGSFFLGGAVVTAMLVPGVWVTPDFITLLGLIAIGLFGMFFQYLYSFALGALGATMVAPFTYTTLLWAFLFDYFIFGVLPDMYGVIGSLLVVADALFAMLSIYYERRRKSSSLG